jgi:ubiquinone/menaquinone biosynthesis C-methylase UbiE
MNFVAPTPDQSSNLPTGRFVLPAVVVSHFHLRPGDAVADLGAGSGYFLSALAAAVGPGGKVYACEIQKNLVETLGTVARSKGLSQVIPLWCDLEERGGVPIADGVLDVAFLINTLFQCDDKATVVTEAMRALRFGGKLIVIDWTESFGGLGPQPADVFPKTAAVALATAAGLVEETSFDAGDHHYGVSFKKP